MYQLKRKSLKSLLFKFLQFFNLKRVLEKEYKNNI